MARESIVFGNIRPIVFAVFDSDQTPVSSGRRFYGVVIHRCLWDVYLVLFTDRTELVRPSCSCRDILQGEASFDGDRPSERMARKLDSGVLTFFGLCRKVMEPDFCATVLMAPPLITAMVLSCASDLLRKSFSIQTFSLSLFLLTALTIPRRLPCSLFPSPNSRP